MRNSVIIFILISFAMCACRKERYESDYVFKGQDYFLDKEKDIGITCDRARGILLSELKKQNKSYVAYPEEVVMIYEDGYLFITGDFKNVIQLKGYYVNSDGVVEWVDSGKAISVHEYMDQLKRGGWQTLPN